jgi:transcriptional regulator with XRE-family HTH domain
MHIGLKIKMVRIAKGISQQELADLINRTRPLISHIEQTGQVNEKTLDTICKSLKISGNDLDGFVNEPKNSYKSYKQSNTTVFDEIDLLKEEIKILKDLVQSQKEIIEMLKSKRKMSK